MYAIIPSLGRYIFYIQGKGLNYLKFIDLSDVTQLMQKIVEAMDETDPFYADFKFFSAINYTTQSEYRQELKRRVG